MHLYDSYECCPRSSAEKGSVLYFHLGVNIRSREEDLWANPSELFNTLIYRVIYRWSLTYDGFDLDFSGAKAKHIQ